MAKPRRTQPHRDDAMPGITRIGRQVAARRIELHLTQQTLADLAGVSRSSLQALEYGSRSVKLASVVEIADALGLQLELATQRTESGG